MPARKTSLIFDYDEICCLLLQLYPGYEHEDTDENGITLSCEDGSVDAPPDFKAAITSIANGF